MEPPGCSADAGRMWSHRRKSLLFPDPFSSFKEEVTGPELTKENKQHTYTERKKANGQDVMND